LLVSSRQDILFAAIPAFYGLVIYSWSTHRTFLAVHHPRLIFSTWAALTHRLSYPYHKSLIASVGVEGLSAPYRIQVQFVLIFSEFMSHVHRKNVIFLLIFFVYCINTNLFN